MRFEYQKNESIPPLSWLAEISKWGGVITIAISFMLSFLAEKYIQYNINRRIK